MRQKRTTPKRRRSDNPEYTGFGKFTAFLLRKEFENAEKFPSLVNSETIRKLKALEQNKHLSILEENMGLIKICNEALYHARENNEIFDLFRLIKMLSAHVEKELGMGIKSKRHSGVEIEKPSEAKPDRQRDFDYLNDALREDLETVERVFWEVVPSLHNTGVSRRFEAISISLSLNSIEKHVALIELFTEAFYRTEKSNEKINIARTINVLCDQAMRFIEEHGPEIVERKNP